MSDLRKEYIAKARRNLDLINARIMALEAKADEKTDETGREVKETISSIRESRDQAKNLLVELRLASKPAWEDAKQGVEKACELLLDALDRAAERLR